MPLEGPDQHLRAAHGFIELGMFEEANAELEEIDPFCRHLPEVLTASSHLPRSQEVGTDGGCRRQTPRLESAGGRPLYQLRLRERARGRASHARPNSTPVTALFSSA